MTTKAKGKCPICKQPSHTEYRPFCSRRCADEDLGRWLTGVYRIPGEAVVEDDDETPPADRE